MGKLFIYLIFINIITFFIYGADKYKAQKKKWRIPEKKLFLLALIGGSIGAEAGMLCFRHKTKHLRFMIGIPAIFLFQICILLGITYMVN